MAVIASPQLARLLDERKLSVSALCRVIADRFGTSVDPKTLYRLTQSAPVQRADLEIAGATAAIALSSLNALRSKPSPTACHVRARMKRSAATERGRTSWTTPTRESSCG